MTTCKYAEAIPRIQTLIKRISNHLEIIKAEEKETITRIYSRETDRSETNDTTDSNQTIRPTIL